MKRIIFFIIEKIRKALKVDEKGNSFGWGKGALLLAALMMVGCENSVEKDTNLVNENYHVIIYDSCEYISGITKWDLTHKGNCRFCKERRQRELEELVTKLKEK